MNSLTIFFCIICFLELLIIIKVLTAKPDGYIVVNQLDPEKDVYTLELGIPFGELDTRKRVVFYIRHVL